MLHIWPSDRHVILRKNEGCRGRSEVGVETVPDRATWPAVSAGRRTQAAAPPPQPLTAPGADRTRDSKARGSVPTTPHCRRRLPVAAEPGASRVIATLPLNAGVLRTRKPQLGHGDRHRPNQSSSEAELGFTHTQPLRLGFFFEGAPRGQPCGGLGAGNGVGEKEREEGLEKDGRNRGAVIQG